MAEAEAEEKAESWNCEKRRLDPAFTRQKIAATCFEAANPLLSLIMQGVTSEVGVAVKLKNQFAVKSKSTKMMPANGLDHKGMLLPKKVLKAREGLYFSAIALSMWDNIHGPKILQVWQGPGKKSRSQDDKATRTPVSEEEMCDLSCE